METDRVSRIVSTFIAVAAFAVCVARHFLFPESSYTIDIPIAALVVISLCGIWAPRKAKNENPNK